MPWLTMWFSPIWALHKIEVVEATHQIQLDFHLLEMIDVADAASAQRRHMLCHARALLGIGQPPASRGKIVDHVLGLIGAGDDCRHRRMGEDELEKELAPTCTAKIRRPIGQLAAQGLTK